MGPPRGCLVMLLLAMLMAGRLLQGTEKQTQEEQEKLDDQLIEAVRNKDLVLVNSLVKKGANVNAVEEVGPLFATGQRTPLLEAIRLGDPSLVEALLKLGAQGNLPDVHGATPLAEAAAIGWGPEHPQADGEKILNLLIKSGAKVNANQGKESSPLAYAASHELSSVKLLLKAGAKIDLTVLEGAAVSGHPEILAELLKQGGQATELLPHHQTLYHSVASIFWRTDLLSSQKRIEVLDLLWQAHVPVDVADDDGDTPLHLAAVRGHVPMVRWLLEHQADPNQIDKDGHRPLWYAARNGPMFVSMALLLRKHGAEVEGGAEADVFTTLIEQNNWPALVPMFDAGWRPRSAIRFAFALTRCETERHVPPELLPAMMDRLIPLIKDINEKDDEGLSLLIWLVKAGDDKTLRILLKQRALKVDQRDAMGRTALIWSGMVASQPIHQMLLQAGADAGLRDEAGRSAADYLKLSEVGAGKKRFHRH